MSGTRGEITVRGVTYDYWVQAESGWFLLSGAKWEGYRVRYRKRDNLKWRHALLVDHHHEPTTDELVAAIEAHRDGSTGASS